MTELAQDINDYINQCWLKSIEYTEGVRDGSIIVNQEMKNVISWFKEHPGYEIKRKKVERVFRFFYLVNIYNDKTSSFERLQLQPWQCCLILMLFGFYEIGTNNRRFKESFTFMGRGNGKTTLGVALSLYFLLGYKQKSPQAIIISTVENRKQIIDYLHRTTMNSPELYPFIHTNNGAIMLNSIDANIQRGERHIERVDDIGSIKVVPNNAKKLDGLEIVLAFIDEIHELKDELVYRNAQKSAAKRKESLVMLISTGGHSSTGFCVDMVDYAKKVANGIIKDDSFLPFLYCLDNSDDKEDIGNRDIWYKCNPSLGVTKSLQTMEKYYNDSLYSPKAKAEFVAKDLNIFIDYKDEEILSEEDLNMAAKPVDLDKWNGKDCYLGLDLSMNNDLSSLVCLFHDDETDTFESYPFFWLGNESKFIKRKSGDNISEWIRKGYITVCKTREIDYALIVNKIKELTEKFNVIGIGYDTYGWDLFKKYLNKEDVYCGEEFVVYQRGRLLGTSLCFVMRYLYTHKLIYSSNPVMKWNWKNAVIDFDDNGNYRIKKNESKDSIDGAIAINDAMAFYFYKRIDPNTPAF